MTWEIGHFEYSNKLGTCLLIGFHTILGVRDGVDASRWGGACGVSH